MKNAILLVGFLLTLISIANLAKPKSKTKRKVFFQGEFYLQKLYSGTNPMDNLKFSEANMKLRHITLTPKILYYSNNENEKMMIREAIYLDEIVDKKGDLVNHGKCCINIKYFNYSDKKIKIAKKVPYKSKKMNLLRKQIHADYCLEVLAPEQARWRICSKIPMDIYRLHLKLVFAVIKLNMTPNTSQKVLIEKFLSNSLLAPDKMAVNWNWETQNQWGGQCKSSFMQSPFPIKDEDDIITLSQEANFKITYNLLDTNVKIVRRFNEIVITFLNDPGLFKISIGTKFILYRPQYISFRFPAEHIILGKRHNGELQIHCKELTKDPKKMRTKGFIFSVPLIVHENHVNLEVLESLNIDFWKFEVNDSDLASYKPTDYLTKKSKPFKLSQLMKNVVELKPLYYFYLGSLNTPPCDEFVNHLVVGKPLQISNCQLKVLRENSLATESPKQIHARMFKEEERNKDDDDKDGKKRGKGRFAKVGSINIMGSGSGSGNGFGGKRGIYAISDLGFDSNIDMFVDEDLKMDPLINRKNLFKFRKNFEEGEDDLNC